MALTNDDKQWIKGAIADGVVEGRLQALTNDIKEIYDVIYGKPNKSFMSASFAKMSSKEKLLVINEELLKMAKDAGVVLPR
ncbi:hypothetical protein GWK76_01145 [Candidatus Saccharibacteria bacterium oral taxon 488]|jgi:hypothetical protein|nr:hypothetical protein GWK76_01145 [Candidatus Saccharibacteria bacterium oral taxon 488]QHU93634.1 hypothetical protein GWK78_01110 [Candidatus Saccharibacteria bacterium oral taxon 488]QJU07304.1 hypothetical protein FBF29_01125 [Candidatus Saccharibacteria bacterium oral taxon 488]QJU10780.1 hypothetical protein FBF25_01140 [Candidatus Saccharibacteria bacterium oral taxon 488]QLF51665.1 hypothetical protein HW277_01150 [Candidatus Saccharibacteria bacterium oral taxon 488]